MSQTVTESAIVSEHRFHVSTDVHLLLLQDGKGLFRLGTGDGVYHPPSVHPEEAESVIEALIREARKAIGVTVKPENVSLAHVTQDLTGDGSITFFFAVSRWDGEPHNLEPQKFSDLRWFPLHDLPSGVVNRARAAMRHYVSGEMFSTTAAACNEPRATERSPTLRSDVAGAVAAFHEAFDLPRRASPRADIDESLARLRVALLEEEFGELVQAVAENDLIAIADALADIVYVAYGTALTYGVDLDSVLGEVHRANMSKLGSDGRPIRRDDGKVLKSDQYSPPDVAAALRLPSRSPTGRDSYSNEK